MRAAILLIMAAMGLMTCEPPATRSEQMRQWLSKSRRGCRATASMLKELRRGVATFASVYNAEFDKTKTNRRPLTRYNPQFLTRLEAALRPLDATEPPLTKRLAQDVWPSHYRFVKKAPEILPRLHHLLVLLAQLRSTVAIARRLEKRYSHTLAQKLAPRNKPAPKLGIRLKSEQVAVFLSKLPPQPKPSRKRTPNAPWRGTVRAFKPDDAELMNRVECRGRDQIVYTAHLYHLMQIKLILAEIKKLDLRGLTIAFRRSGE